MRKEFGGALDVGWTNQENGGCLQKNEKEPWPSGSLPKYFCKPAAAFLVIIRSCCDNSASDVKWMSWSSELSEFEVPVLEFGA